MFKNFNPLSGYPSPDQINQNDKKRAQESKNDSTLDGVQPVKKTKILSSTLNSVALKEAPSRLYTSEPYATNLQVPYHSDILLSRGAHTRFHAGNIELKTFIMKAVNIETHASLQKAEKKKRCLRLLEALHSDTPRRRFLQKNIANDCYHEVHDEIAIEKILRIILNIRKTQKKN